jgi:hypothetical protein
VLTVPNSAPRQEDMEGVEVRELFSDLAFELCVRRNKARNSGEVVVATSWGAGWVIHYY